MNSIDFCFWLQGYFEISNSKSLSDEQVEVIKNHLALTFKHEIDPLRESETSALPIELDAAHLGVGSGNDKLIRC